MKKGKLKWIIIVVVAIILITVGVLAFLYFTTDIFKSNQELFFKYIAQNDKIVETLQMSSNEQSADKLLKQSKYTTEANINFQLTSNDTQIANQAIPPRNFSINYTGKTDGLNQKQSSQTTLKYLTKDLFTLKYIRNADSYGVTSDEVINKYLTFENNNLQEFVKKFGVTNVASIPNKIESVNWNTLMNFTEQEKETLLQKSMTVITNKVTAEHYTKKKNVTIAVNNKEILANEYALTLTQKEANDTLYDLLDSFENDDTILNIILGKVKAINSNATLTNVKETLQSIKKEINKNTNNDITIKLAVYETEGSLVKTAYIASDGNQIIMDRIEEGRIMISFGYNYTKDTTREETANIVKNKNSVNGYKVKSIEIGNKTVGTQTEREYIITLEKDNDIVKVAVQNKMNNKLESGTLERETIINLDLSNVTYFTIKCVSTDTLVNDIAVEELTSQNSVKVNNFTAEYSAQLMQAIINRVTILYNQKMQVINAAQQEENNNTNQGTNPLQSNNENQNQITE